MMERKPIVLSDFAERVIRKLLHSSLTVREIDEVMEAVTARPAPSSPPRTRAVRPSRRRYPT